MLPHEEQQPQQQQQLLGPVVGYRMSPSHNEDQEAFIASETTTNNNVQQQQPPPPPSATQQHQHPQYHTSSTSPQQHQQISLTDELGTPLIVEPGVDLDHLNPNHTSQAGQSRTLEIETHQLRPSPLQLQQNLLPDHHEEPEVPVEEPMNNSLKSLSRFKWTKEKTQVALNLVKHGCKPKLVSVAVGCSLRTAQKFVETVTPKIEGESFKNYEIRRRGRKSKDVNQRLEAIREVLSKDSTKTQVEIAADLKVSNTTVCRDLKKIGANWRDKKLNDPQQQQEMIKRDPIKRDRPMPIKKPGSTPIKNNGTSQNGKTRGRQKTDDN